MYFFLMLNLNNPQVHLLNASAFGSPRIRHASSSEIDRTLIFNCFAMEIFGQQERKRVCERKTQKVFHQTISYII